MKFLSYIESLEHVFDAKPMVTSAPQSLNTEELYYYRQHFISTQYYLALYTELNNQ